MKYRKHGNVEESVSISLNVPPRQDPSRYDEIVQSASSFFEKLASYKHIKIISATIRNLCFLALIGLEITLLSYSPMDKESTLFYVPFRESSLLLFLLSSSFASFSDREYKSRRHFADIEKRLLLYSFICFSIYVILVCIFEVRGWDILAIIIIVMCLILILLICFVNAQRATKLRFDPTRTNQDFPNISTVSKTKGSVEIVESNVFTITLKNIGNEIWNSKDFVVHRHADYGKGTRCVQLKLPSFSLIPQEQIDLIPETYSFEGKCVRIPGFHCFGSGDRTTIVKTFLNDDGSNRKSVQEEDGMCFYKSKVSEFIAAVDLKMTEWAQVTVNESV